MDQMLLVYLGFVSLEESGGVKQSILQAFQLEINAVAMQKNWKKRPAKCSLSQKKSSNSLRLHYHEQPFFCFLRWRHQICLHRTNCCSISTRKPKKCLLSSEKNHFGYGICMQRLVFRFGTTPKEHFQAKLNSNSTSICCDSIEINTSVFQNANRRPNDD
jgi:hypothetical protein